jgi:uncharacterized repeat protein (TIGR01451 family)
LRSRSTDGGEGNWLAGRLSAGDELHYTIRVTNPGKEPVTDIVVTKRLPFGVHYIRGSAVGPGCKVEVSIDGGTTFSAPTRLGVSAIGKRPTRKVSPSDFTHAVDFRKPLCRMRPHCCVFARRSPDGCDACRDSRGRATCGCHARVHGTRAADRHGGDVAAALNERRQLIVEAGTGTGKTFARTLVPALTSGRRVIVSTGTRALQDQLFHRDLPMICAALAARSVWPC